MGVPDDLRYPMTEAKKMDALDRINDLSKKLCLIDNQRWEPDKELITSEAQNNLSDDDKKKLTLQREESFANQKDYSDEAQHIFSRLQSCGYTITTN